jgi:hypothetical protein
LCVVAFVRAAEEREFLEDGFEGEETAADDVAGDAEQAVDVSEAVAAADGEQEQEDEEEEEEDAEAAQAETAQNPEAEGRRRLLIFRRDMRR